MRRFRAVAEVGGAVLIGQSVHLLSPIIPFTYLPVGLVDVPFDEYQRNDIKWAFPMAMVMLTVTLLTAVFPLVARM